ncbi:MAG: hypothetical protein ACK56F_24060, partial [bacterium]
MVLLEALSKGELLFGVLLRMPSNPTSIESALPDVATAKLGVVNQLLFDDWLSETAWAYLHARPTARFSSGFPLLWEL